MLSNKTNECSHKDNAEGRGWEHGHEPRSLGKEGRTCFGSESMLLTKGSQKGTEALYTIQKNNNNKSHLVVKINK